MEKYYKNNYIKSVVDKEDIEFQIIEWHQQDEKDEKEEEEQEVYTIRTFGVTQEGVSVTCKIRNFTPFYYIKVSNNFNKNKKDLFIDYIKTSWQLSKAKVNGESVSLSECLLSTECKIIEKKDLYGYKANKQYRFLRLTFNNYTAMNKSKYLFKNPIQIRGISNEPVKYKLYESNIEPFMRFCHIKDIRMAGWIKLPKEKYTIDDDMSTTQMNVSINYKDVISLSDKKAIANFLQASWDIETYSIDGTFPDPNKKVNNEFPNVIYQIGTTFKYYNEKNTLIKHLLTLKKCAKIDDSSIIIEECKTEKDLIKRWIDLISEMDPDIMYTYNGDTFDCMYIFERSKLYNLDSYLKTKLSRHSDIPMIVKKEKFSSSAYGDSDFIRFYIPGRLNYDLLIHYKRGMKKYSSYKLDYIANSILGKGKNEVTAKDIFKYYEEGKPEQIRTIAEYCIIDTELLQQLVDKQLILITIIQLANVTFVPIGYLTTRGQTIKVFSQLLRKARQMNYLVPHTNFNEDAYPLTIRSKDEHGLEQEDVGNYIKVSCGRNKNSYGKLIEINGKISEIIDDHTFIILSSIELEDDETFTSKYSYKNDINKQINLLCKSDDLIDTSFSGATVLTATPGYFAQNISVLDFASLYPTIMISRNLCYSTFIRDTSYIPKDLPDEDGIYNIKGVNYERIKWDDRIEYTLNHMCEGVGKSGKGKDQVCGKQAYFEVNLNNQLNHYKLEIEDLEIELDSIEELSEQKKIKTKIKTKEKELVKFEQSLKNLETNVPKYYCRVHDPLKTRRLPEEKYQKKDVSYNYVIVQPHTEIIDGKETKVNQGVLPALLEELYAERKLIKKEMAKAAENGDSLLEDILNCTQLGIKVSLNSCYGFLGRGQGNLILKELASIVTSVGRKLIQQSKTYAETEFVNYIKENNLLTQTIEYKPELVESIDPSEKDIILEQFKCVVSSPHDEIKHDEIPKKKSRKKILEIN